MISLPEAIKDKIIEYLVSDGASFRWPGDVPAELDEWYIKAQNVRLRCQCIHTSLTANQRSRGVGHTSLAKQLTVIHSLSSGGRAQAGDEVRLLSGYDWPNVMHLDIASVKNIRPGVLADTIKRCFPKLNSLK
ncbi:hypothetical protein EV182_007331, partial [Spiromyces aspiralis]